MKKIYNRLIVILFILFVSIFSVYFIIEKDREYSDVENRYLSKNPSFSLEDILSGEYMINMERYINDQFPMRNKLISMKTDFLRVVGNKEINGVYFADDGYLIEKWSKNDFDDELFRKNIDAINSFAKKYSTSRVSIMLVPTASLIYRDKISKNAQMVDQQVLSNFAKNSLVNVNYVDLIPVFLLDNKGLFYKTDHHWTTKGAFLAYKEWSNINVIDVNIKDFEVIQMNDDFQGSLHSKVLNNDCEKDKIETYKRNEQSIYQVYYDFGKNESNTIYEMKHLQHKDKYQVFLDGNHAEIKINTSQMNGKHLLVIKDSFANAFIPFLISDYETIHIIDLRYYNEDIFAYITENEINEYLFLYNFKNFSEDENLKKIRI